MAIELNGETMSTIESYKNIPLARASQGHFMVIYSAPIYFAGYYALMRLFNSTSYWASRTMLVLGIYAFAVGGIWISSRYLMIEVMQSEMVSANAGYFIDAYSEHYGSIQKSLIVSIVIVSLLYIYLVLSNKLNLPKWIALSNPALLIGLLYSSQYWMPPLGYYLAPCAISVAHFVFFSVLLYHYKKKVASKI